MQYKNELQAEIISLVSKSISDITKRDQISLTLRPSSTTVVWAETAAVSHIVRPTEESDFMKILLEVSQRFHRKFVQKFLRILK